jgi:3-oxoacyl-[acyl-carrier protein] reductase
VLLKDKVIIVTGGSRGIGKEMVKVFAREGASVILNYSNSRVQAELLQEELSGLKVFPYRANVTEEFEVKKMMDNVYKEFGKIDVLINNAGITNDKFLVQMTLADWERVLLTNLTGAFLCSKYAIKKMLRHHNGKVIMVSSIAGILGNKGQGNYSASKAGLIGLSKTIAQEYGERGITANVIAPGVIDTEMSRQIPIEEQKIKIDEIIMRRPGQSIEVANSALFLASSLSDYVNGEVIRIDGGIRF